MAKAINTLRLALLQLKGSSDKTANVRNAIIKIEKVVKDHQPHLITLPECFNCPYGTKYFREYAEQIPDGFTSQQLSKAALENQVFIVGGTIPELGENDRIFNTCTVWAPSGELIAKHRKMHLFDIDVKGGIRFKESETLSPGNEFTTFKIEGRKIGIGICYDIRFEEMARLYRNDGCEMIIYPAAFNMTTGPLHWELLQRARANDNQLFVVTTSPARDLAADYVAYGHSMIVDPWAKIIACADEGEQTVTADIDFAIVDQVRQQIPVFSQRRLDLYGTELK
ncbi:omega-amidase NIT2 isoform X1 [Drosophila nasuta]|uniref:omega-amidase n=1 Tax=Drosophila albomicans TaxID=7291 RepID=A0A6P8XNN4_DROAB|nr:omega-amidase NIT2 isoform X1 [Drosophila albomicans]XP_060648980.1 omega-amidase NIT2 isoform X1 [Drosophila nasuta]